MYSDRLPPPSMMVSAWDHVLRTALVNLHAFDFGYTVAFTGATLQSMIDAVDLCDGADLCAEASFVASAAPLGALLASAGAGRLLDTYGRRPFLIAVSALWVAGYVIVACASSLMGFAAGRIIAGAAMGATSVAVPVYAAELSPPKLRGSLGGLFNVLISAGILAVFALGANGTDDGTWRWMALAAVLPAVFVGVDLHRDWVPESPRWLARQGREVEARLAAERLFGRGAEADEACAVEAPSTKRAASQRSVAVGVGVVGCFGFCGNSCIQAYMSVVLEGAGLSEASARTGAITYASTQFVFAVMMALWGVARFVRRPLLIASAMGAAASLAAMASFTEAQDGLASLLSADAYIASVTLGLSTLSWVYCAEVLPDGERGRGMAYATVLFWGVTFASLQLFNVAVATLTVAGVLGLFVLFSAGGALFCYGFVVETRGAVLSDVQRLFADTPASPPASEGDALLA